MVMTLAAYTSTRTGTMDQQIRVACPSGQVEDSLVVLGAGSSASCGLVLEWQSPRQVPVSLLQEMMA